MQSTHNCSSGFSVHLRDKHLCALDTRESQTKNFESRLPFVICSPMELSVARHFGSAMLACDCDYFCIGLRLPLFLLAYMSCDDYHPLPGRSTSVSENINSHFYTEINHIPGMSLQCTVVTVVKK